MAAHTSTKLDPDAHLVLEAPLLRLPHELLKKNLKSAQRAIEPVSKSIPSSLLLTTSHHQQQQSPAEALASLDAALAKAQNLKRKLEALREEERVLHRQQEARIRHLRDLHEIAKGEEGVGGVAYQRWAGVRLDRLLVDYLLRRGFGETARKLAEESADGDSLGELVDVRVFQEAGRIERALGRGEVKEALAWCAEHRTALKKIGSELELELRLQQLVELARSGETGKLVEAVAHARKFLGGGQAGGEREARFGLYAGGLIAFGSDTFVEPYQTLYSASRYPHLSTLFTSTHHTLFSLPSNPLLHTALSAGLSALKTPACHSAHALNTTLNTGFPVCPICSTELNELARSVPYAHHSTSSMEEDAVALPNGRVFGRERLRVLCEKGGVRKGWVRDPSGGDVEWEEGVLRKVFIS